MFLTYFSNHFSTLEFNYENPKNLKTRSGIKFDGSRPAGVGRLRQRRTGLLNACSRRRFISRPALKTVARVVCRQ
jgi:hypothetical protein